MKTKNIARSAHQQFAITRNKNAFKQIVKLNYIQTWIQFPHRILFLKYNLQWRSHPQYDHIFRLKIIFKL